MSQESNSHIYRQEKIFALKQDQEKNFSLPVTVKEWLQLPRPLVLSEQMLDDFGLKSFLNYQVGHLSPGIRKRVELVKLLSQHPKLLLLDEPCSAVDQAGRAVLKRYLRRLQDQGAAVVIVDHHLDFLKDLEAKLYQLNQRRLNP